MNEDQVYGRHYISFLVVAETKHRAVMEAIHVKTHLQAMAYMDPATVTS